MSRTIANDVTFDLPMDDRTFNAVFKCYWERVYTICKYYTVDVNDAADLTQTIFLDLWKNKDNLAADSNLEHYLSKAARFQAFTYIRNRSTQQKHMLALTLSKEPHTDSDPHSIMEVADKKAQLDVLIAQLPEPSKTVFILNRFEHLSYREIADQRNITEHTVQYHISRSLRILKEKLVNIG